MTEGKLQGEIVIDACCLLNLLATGEEGDLVRALELRLVVPEPARQEVFYLEGPPDEDGNPTHYPASLDQLESAGLLQTWAIDDQSRDAFVAAASHLKDPDAACAAIAATHRLPLATDDRKIRKVTAELFPDVLLVSTLEIVHRAASSLDLGPDRVTALLEKLRTRGRFVAPKDDPLAGWFWEILRST